MRMKSPVRKFNGLAGKYASITDKYRKYRKHKNQIQTASRRKNRRRR